MHFALLLKCVEPTCPLSTKVHRGKVVAFSRIYFRVSLKYQVSKAWSCEIIGVYVRFVSYCREPWHEKTFRLQATEEKAKVEAEAAACLTRLSLAERLVGGLSSENERWGNEIEKLRNSATTLVGDCMLASGFVSYVGAFDQGNRDILWKSVWTPGEEE